MNKYIKKIIGKIDIDRKSFFDKYDIIFDGEKILYHEKWIPLLLKDGNSKTGLHVLTWSMVPGTAGNGTCICDCKGCYAKTGTYNYQTAKDSNELNTSIVNNDIDFFYRAVSAQIEMVIAEEKLILAKLACNYNEIKSLLNNPEITKEEHIAEIKYYIEKTKKYIENKLLAYIETRIHASGDFNTKNPDQYVNTWKRIIREQIEAYFWTYTKMTRYEKAFDEFKNGNIVKSVIEGIGYNFGRCDYLIETYTKLKKAGFNVWICKCGFDKNQHCQMCARCSNYDFVLFLEHGTGYKAEKDPLYETLKELVFSQE